MSQSQILWLFYLAVFVVRISATSRRLRLPKIRGEEYFFNIHVGAGFYSGPGRPILAAYRRWMLLPFLIDIVALPIIIVVAGSPQYLVHLMLGGMAAGILIYVKGATRTGRQAKRFAVDAPTPVAQVALSLTPRRVGDYTNWTMEAIIAAMTVGCLAAFARVWLHDAEREPLLDFFRVPLLILYLNLGALLMKRAIVAWRTPAPSDDAEAYLAWREGLRRCYLFICDAVRLVWTSVLVIVAVAISFEEPWETGSMQTGIAIATLVILAAWCVWYSHYSKGVVAVALARKPVDFPSVMATAEPRPGAVCYRRATPLSIIRTDRGLALNLGSRRTQLAGLYLCGLILLTRL